MKVVTKKTATKLNLKFYYTGKPCKRGHIAHRYVSNSTCFECAQTADKKYRNNNKTLIKARRLQWNQQNPTYHKKWREENPHYSDEWNSNHPEYQAQYQQNHKEQMLKYAENWRKRHPHKLRSMTALRRARIIQAIPKWANVISINKIYEHAIILKDTTNVVYHVDHIIPLVNDLVCGLHCEDNLQVITSDDNLSKGNKFDV